MQPHEVISRILKEIRSEIKVGTTGLQIDAHAGELIKKYGVTSVNRGYSPEWGKSPWKHYTCVNVNYMIAHGVPNDYPFEEGDLVSVDLGIKTPDGKCGDAAFSMGVGRIARRDEKLLYYANQIIFMAASLFKPGISTEYIAGQIESYALSRGYLVNRQFAGHAIGEQMHMKPSIYNTPEPTHKYAILEKGQIYCIEPMLTYSKDNMGMRISSDNDWTVITSDQKNSCFFEAMVEVTDIGGRILTDHFEDMQYEK